MIIAQFLDEIHRGIEVNPCFSAGMIILAVVLALVAITAMKER